MLDIEYLRNHHDEAAQKIKDRGFNPSQISKVLEIDQKRRTLLQEVEELRSRRNQASKERNIEQGKQLKLSLAKLEEDLKTLDGEFLEALKQLPNVALDEVPVGEPGQFKVIKDSGKPRQFDFEPKDHLELGEKLDIIDTLTAAKVSGSRFSYLKGPAVMLEMALVNFALHKLVQNGFTPVIPPALIRRDITEKLGYWQGGGKDNYYLVKNLQQINEDDSAEMTVDLYLIGTGEHALVPMLMDEVIAKSDLPKRFVAFSPCFRREAGTYGKDTRGIIRVHQFDKVEMVSFCHPEQDQEEFDKLLSLSWEMMKELGLPARQVLLTSEDISIPAAKTIDIEAWFPSQKSYRETHSISTTTDYQARRLNTKYTDGSKAVYEHILNGTAFAIGRTIAAILENYQRSDGSVEVPEALRKYTGFDEIRA